MSVWMPPNAGRNMAFQFFVQIAEKARKSKKIEEHLAKTGFLKFTGKGFS